MFQRKFWGERKRKGAHETWEKGVRLVEVGLMRFPFHDSGEGLSSIREIRGAEGAFLADEALVSV